MDRSGNMGVGVIDLRLYRDASYTPLVVFVDLQQEYVTRHRALKLESAERALANCRMLLQETRDNGFPVAFTRWSQNSKYFNAGQAYSDWIEGFEPHGSDMVFERSMPSCYSNEWFAEMMEHGGAENAILAGFTGPIACLSTIIDAYNRGHNITFVADASASHALEARSESATHEMVSQIISLYSPVTTTENWIADQARRHRVRQSRRPA